MASTSTFRVATSTSPWRSPPRSKLSTSGRCTTGAADPRIDDLTAQYDRAISNRSRKACPRTAGVLFLRAVLSLTGIGGKVVAPTLPPRQANGGERVHDRRLLHPCANGLRGGLRLA